MYCSNCGEANADDVANCVHCGASLANPYEAGAVPGGFTPLPGERIPNYLLQAILVTCCCSPLFGMVAVVFAAQVNGKIAAGDLHGAWRASQRAKNWCWIALLLGPLVSIAIALVEASAARHAGHLH